ncbi:unnamed protein product [Symbiodinium sp. CCMP2456]|nr:unnamed protein product [Symbiodinium sp. CCMP2456]
MAKRLRRLTSLLWSDEGDGVELHRAWYQAEACQGALATPCYDGCTAIAQMEKLQELEQDNKNLVEMNQALRKQLNCSGNGTTMNLPTLPRLVVKKRKTVSVRGPGDFLNALPRDIRAHPRTQQICNDLEQSGLLPSHVSFDLDDSKLGSAILDHCELSISTLWKKPSIASALLGTVVMSKPLNSNVWSSDTLNVALATVDAQQCKDEIVDAEIEDC